MRRPARIIAMAMEDGGGASSSMVQQQQQQPAFGHAQPPPFWSTPTPYLFIGFAVVMSLIAVALAVLLCSRRNKEEEEGRRGGEGRREVVSVRVLAPLDREDGAKVVVVMAGDHAPSFLASAAPFAATFVGVGKAAPAEQMPHPRVGGDKDGGATAV